MCTVVTLVDDLRVHAGPLPMFGEGVSIMSPDWLTCFIDKPCGTGLCQTNPRGSGAAFLSHQECAAGRRHRVLPAAAFFVFYCWSQGFILESDVCRK